MFAALRPPEARMKPGSGVRAARTEKLAAVLIDHIFIAAEYRDVVVAHPDRDRRLEPDSAALFERVLDVIEVVLKRLRFEVAPPADEVGNGSAVGLERIEDGRVDPFRFPAAGRPCRGECGCISYDII